MAEVEKYVCEKCGKTMSGNQFYTYRDGSKTEMCKKCLTLHIDNFDPSTFTWLLERMDVPYVEEEWNILRDRAFAKNPQKMNGTSVFGKYLSKMRLNQWKNKTWADSEALQKEYREKQKIKEEKKKAENEKTEAFLQKQLQEGKITQAEYQTLTPTKVQYEQMMLSPLHNIASTVDSNNSMIKMAQNSQNAIGAHNTYNENELLDEDSLIDVGAQLTAEDKVFLAMKWGRLYKPSEWVELEKKYKEMKSSFDIQDSDTEGTLILLCKTYLKMNQAIDASDMDGYQKLSRVYDSLRKSAKFTAAQNKEAKSDFIDSIGEMVAYCEQYGGKIPRYEIDTPRDIVDKVIKDLKNYNKDLIYEDTALAREIEDYLQQRKIAEQRRRDKMEAEKQGLNYVKITNEDLEERFRQLQEEKEHDEALLNNLTDGADVS